MKTRRIAIVGLVVAVLLVALWQARPHLGASTRSITVLSFGGSFADAQRQAYFHPFATRTGIEVKEATYNGEYGKLKAMTDTGSVAWDVVDVESSALIRGKRDNIFVPIDYTVMKSGDLVPQSVNSHGVGADLYSVSLGYSTTRFPQGSPQPQTWADFWNVEKFPGPRCMKRDPRFTLEIALIADGVALADVYGRDGLDVDRAFRSLDKIKKHVHLWWTTGAQPIEALSNGEVVMAAAFGARMWLAKHPDGKPIDMTWNQSIIDTEYWAVLKGAPDIGASMKFIAFASEAEPQAAFSTAFPLGPSNVKTLDRMDPARARELNTHPDQLKKQLFFNAEWWASSEAAVTERFNSWLSE